MTQLTLFATMNEEPTERKRKIETFDSYDLAHRYAVEAWGSGRYAEVYLTGGNGGKTLVLLEWDA